MKAKPKAKPKPKPEPKPKPTRAEAKREAERRERRNATRREARRLARVVAMAREVKRLAALERRRAARRAVREAELAREIMRQAALKARRDARAREREKKRAVALKAAARQVEREKRAAERQAKREDERSKRMAARLAAKEQRRLDREAKREAERLKRMAARLADRERRRAAREAERARKKAEREKAKRRPVSSKVAKAAQTAALAIGAMMAAACEAATRVTGHPCDPSVAINRDWTVDGELRIPAPAIDVKEVLYALETSGVWRMASGYWISVGYIYSVDPRHQVAQGEAPDIVSSAKDEDEEESATEWRSKYRKRAGTYQELAYPQRENRIGENFATARSLFDNILPYGFRIREILIRVRWSVDGERPPGKHEK